MPQLLNWWPVMKGTFDCSLLFALCSLLIIVQHLTRSFHHHSTESRWLKSWVRMHSLNAQPRMDQMRLIRSYPPLLAWAIAFLPSLVVRFCELGTGVDCFMVAIVYFFFFFSFFFVMFLFCLLLFDCQFCNIWAFVGWFDFVVIAVWTQQFGFCLVLVSQVAQCYCIVPWKALIRFDSFDSFIHQPVLCIPFHSNPFQSIPFHSIPIHSNPFLQFLIPVSRILCPRLLFCQLVLLDKADFFISVCLEVQSPKPKPNSQLISTQTTHHWHQNLLSLLSLSLSLVLLFVLCCCYCCWFWEKNKNKTKQKKWRQSNWSWCGGVFWTSGCLFWFSRAACWITMRLDMTLK